MAATVSGFGLKVAAVAAVVFAVGCGGPQVSGAATEPGVTDDAQRGDAGPRWGQDDIEAGMAQISPALIACYQSAARLNRHEAGSITISTALASDGRVRSATAVASSLSQDLTRCLTSVISSAKFRPPGFDGVWVRIPLTFEQDDAGAP